MTSYSSPADIKTFLKQIGKAPLFVCDMDGNVMTGYSLTEGSTIALNSGDDPQRQAIPFGGSPRDLDALVESGVLKKGIFAEKAMDARLPQELVDLVNDSIETKEPFKIAFLTSRGADDARTLLKESGVKDIDHVTLVADSGATLYLQGTKTEVRKLSDDEKKYLEDLHFIADNLQDNVESLVESYGENPKGCPKLYVEEKGIATNIHYREILAHYKQSDNSPLDKALGELIKTKLNGLVASGPTTISGSPVFKTLDGPATVEMKIADINKGHGLASIAAAAMESGKHPSAIIFTGDDVSKGNGTPGTDYYAMVEAKALSHKHGIPFHNIHTLHPVGKDMTSATPDENLSPQTLSEKFDQPKIDLVVPTPVALASIILKANGREGFGEKTSLRISQPALTNEI